MPHSTELLWDTIHEWIDDPESSVEYAEEVEGSVAVRMRQETRDASTVWWTPGQRTLSAELYVLPEPETNVAACHRLVLDRNRSTARVWYASAVDGGIVLRARVQNEHLTRSVLDAVLGELYEQVELTFRPLVRLAFGGA